MMIISNDIFKRGVFRVLKKIIKLVVVAGLSLTTVGFAAEVDKVAAVVDGDIVTKLEVEKMKDFMVVMGAVAKDDNHPETYNQLLSFQVDRMLQLELAKKFKIGTDVSVEKLKNAFLQTRGYTPEELTARLADNNVTEDYFLARLVENRKIEQVQQSFLGSNVKVTDEMAYAFLEKYHNEHTQYLIKDIYIENGNADADKIVAAVAKNEPAPEGAQVVDLGYKTIAELPDIYQSVVMDLKEGSPSKLVTAPNGMHSLLLVEKKEPESIQVEQAKMILYREGMAKEMESWLGKLKQTAYVKIY